MSMDVAEECTASIIMIEKWTKQLLPTGLLFDPEDGGGISLRNTCRHLLDYMALHPKRLYISYL
jgi:hypothetical protein